MIVTVVLVIMMNLADQYSIGICGCETQHPSRRLLCCGRFSFQTPTRSDLNTMRDSPACCLTRLSVELTELWRQTIVLLSFEYDGALNNTISGISDPPGLRQRPVRVKACRRIELEEESVPFSKCFQTKSYGTALVDKKAWII